MITEIEDLSPEQLAGLTGEQIQEIEENPEKINEILNIQEGKDGNRDSETKPAAEKVVETSATPSADAKVKTVEGEPVVLNKSETGTIPYSTLQKHVNTYLSEDWKNRIKAKDVKQLERLVNSGASKKTMMETMSWSRPKLFQALEQYFPDQIAKK